MERRRPCDYLKALTPAHMRDVREHLKAIYAVYSGRQLADDCAQVAILFLWKYPYDLEIGPSMGDERDAAWYVAVHNSLLRFAKSREFRGSVLRTVYKGNFSKVSQTESEGEQDPDPNWDTSIRWFEGNLHWEKVFKSFRAFLAEQPDIDPLEIQLIDQLHKNAVRETIDEGMEDVFRGESFQVVHQPLLEALQEHFRATGWNIEMVRVTLAKIRRHAIQYRESLTTGDLLEFHGPLRTQADSQSSIEKKKSNAELCQQTTSTKRPVS